MEWTEQYIGIPFAEHGRNREGLDCWGMLRLVYRERLSIALPSYSERYVSTADREELARLIRSELSPWRLLPPGAERPYDAILIRVRGEPMHVAVVASAGWMLHVLRGAATCLERYDRSLWKHRIKGFYRYEINQ